MSPSEAQQQPRSPHGPLEREPLEDRGLRLARVRRRFRRHRRRRRHEVPRGRTTSPSARPARATKIIEAGFPRGRRRAGRDRPDPVQDAQRDRSRLQGRDRRTSRRRSTRSRRSAKLDSPLDAGHADQISTDGHARRWSVQPGGHLRRGQSRTSTTIEAAVDKASARHPGFDDRRAR